MRWSMLLALAIHSGTTDMSSPRPRITASSLLDDSLDMPEDQSHQGLDTACLGRGSCLAGRINFGGVSKPLTGAGANKGQ
jgi:hypothetical protein